jgi:hypothetical protein
VRSGRNENPESRYGRVTPSRRNEIARRALLQVRQHLCIISWGIQSRANRYRATINREYRSFYVTNHESSLSQRCPRDLYVVDDAEDAIGRNRPIGNSVIDGHGITDQHRAIRKRSTRVESFRASEQQGGISFVFFSPCHLSIGDRGGIQRKANGRDSRQS